MNVSVVTPTAVIPTVHHTVILTATPTLQKALDQGLLHHQSIAAVATMMMIVEAHVGMSMKGAIPTMQSEDRRPITGDTHHHGGSTQAMNHHLGTVQEVVVHHTVDQSHRRLLDTQGMLCCSSHYGIS